jgi:hypothetical protein
MPFHSTIEPETNPVPETVKGNAADPAVTELGLSPETNPAAGLIVKLAAVDTPPYWLINWMLAVPAAPIRLPGTDAVKVVSDGCVVASGAPFHCTTHPVGQLAPAMVSVKPGAPAVTEDGAIVAIAGGGIATMENGCTSDRPAPVESLTCTVAAPDVRSAAAGITAVSIVELTYVVASAVALKVITSLRVNPTPVHVRLTAGPPPGAVAGVTVKSTGDTMNGAVLDVATPGSATVNGNVPESTRRSGVIAA